MRAQKENKPNRGFKKAFRAGIILVIFLSLLISWISISVINSINNKASKKTTEESPSEEWVSKPDTFYIEKTKEVIVRDTVYKYVQPVAPVKSKTEDQVAPKRDTLSK